MENNQKVKKVSQVIAVILIILLLFGVLAIILKFKNGGTDEFKTFYVEQDGKIFATKDNADIMKGSTARFDVKYTFDVLSDERRDFNVKVVSSATEKTAFAYTVDGKSYAYKDGEDFTRVFAVEKNVKEGYFTIKAPTTLLEALEKLYAGKKVELSVEPDLSETAYFKLLVTSYNEANTVTLSLYLKKPNVGSVEVDRDSIVFGSIKETFSISYVVECAFERPGNDSQWRINFECQETAKVGEKVTFIFTLGGDNGWLESVGVYAGASLIASFSEADSWQPCTFTMPASDVVVRFVIE